MKIYNLSVKEIIDKINKQETFEAQPHEGGFIIKVNKYVPFFCVAVHNGNAMRNELKKKIIHSDYERWYEEDPNTADFISSMPITIIGLDSRFEYDLNRSPEKCIYDVAWGKKVWKRKLTSNEIKVSKQKHHNYYKVLHALVTKLESLFEQSVLYDIHSYNYQRWDRDVPLFNIGTELVDKNKYQKFIDKWKEELTAIQVTDIDNSVIENDVFRGKGYTLEYVSVNFKNTLVLATDIKKIYCDEISGDIYPKIVKKLAQTLRAAILNHANYFSKNLENWHYKSAPKLLDDTINSELSKVDKALFSLLRNFELLAVVNPINTKNEKKKFLKNRFTEIPAFKYLPVKINTFRLKQLLLSIPVHDIQDITIRNIYEGVVNAYSDKIDMIGTLNSKKFLYNSLRYFGRPSKKDILNANYLLHLPDLPGEPKNEPVITATEAMELFRIALQEYGINAKIEFSNRVISHVMVLNSKRSILFQPNAKFKKKELKALIEHEIGVHMVTTINSGMQKLKIFNLGMPVNTETQEGMALLAEYLSGNITLRRLKKIALRVIMVDMMCSGADFIDCFNILINDHYLEEDEAFNMVTRVFRGGGFTKDHLYLGGFVKIFRFWNEHNDLTPLLVGKTSLPFYNTIEEMLGREMIEKPIYIAKSYVNPKLENNNAIYDYILSGLKF